MEPKLTDVKNLAITSQTRTQHPAAPLPAATIFALLLALTGIGLTLLVEFFYLRDNFGVRLNSVFKFYFQGWVLMACASAYALWWVNQSAGRVTRALFWLGSGLLIAGGLVYPLMGTVSRVESFRYPPNLDAAATFAGVYPESWGAHPDDWAAVQWLRQRNPLYRSGLIAQPEPVRILEATIQGYGPAGRISAFTGLPTLLGWSGHEGQWRGNNKVQAEREPVIRSIYTTPFAETAVTQLREYNISYVIIGDVERQYINQICATPETSCNPQRALDKFDQAFRLMFSQGSTSIYLVPNPTGN